MELIYYLLALILLGLLLYILYYDIDLKIKNKIKSKPKVNDGSNTLLYQYYGGPKKSRKSLKSLKTLENELQNPYLTLEERERKLRMVNKLKKQLEFERDDIIPFDKN